jgi:hypothetical protein
MPKQSVIVWDLETVPDLAGFAAANDLGGKSDVEVREAIGRNSRSTSTTPLGCTSTDTPRTLSTNLQIC